MKRQDNSPERNPTMSLIKRSICTLCLLIIALSFTFCLTGCDSEETKQAKEEFQTEVDRIEANYDELTTEINSAQELITTDEMPLDENIKPALENTIADAKTVELKTPLMPNNLDEIHTATENLKSINFNDKIQALKEAEKALTNSIEQRKLVTAPTEAFVIERLQGVDGVGEIAAETEETDSNGLLGKKGAYYAKIDFISPLVDQNEVYGSTVVEKGCEGGGSIEVFETEGLAKRRDTYLRGFDGGLFDSGSHRVLGTLVVRTSDALTASQQKQLEANVVAALTQLS